MRKLTIKLEVGAKTFVPMGVIYLDDESSDVKFDIEHVQDAQAIGGPKTKIDFIEMVLDDLAICKPSNEELLEWQNTLEGMERNIK